MNTTGNKKKQPLYTNESILESLRGLGGGVARTIKSDVAGKIGSDALQSIFGPLHRPSETQHPHSETGVERPSPLPWRRPEAYRPPVVHAEEVGIKQKIDAVRAELKALASSVKLLSADMGRVINEAPVDPGIYHLNFFERIKSVLTVLRQQVEDSRTWLALWTTRKKQKHYWGLYKKHGTQFGLSSERTSATQAG